MDGRKNNGGRRKNSGRKAGSGISTLISNVVKYRVDEMLADLLKEPKIINYARKSHEEYSVFNGWIYLIKNNDSGLFKVGITQNSNINSRISTYKSHMMDIELVFYDKVDYVNDLESFIHDKIVNFEKGDWFKCDLNMLCDILKIISHHKAYGRT